MPELTYPLPQGFYIFYDIKEHRGWWTSGGYSVWPGRAKIYTADEANEILKRSAPYVGVERADDFAPSCLDFAHEHLLRKSLVGTTAAETLAATGL